MPALSRTALLIALLLPIAACGNSPQQPSDAVDDRSAGSPDLGGTEDETGTGDGSPDLAQGQDDETGDPNVLSAPEEMDPVVTGVVSDEALLARFSGEWAADPGDCGVGGPSVVSISPSQLDRVGRQCQIASVIDGGDDSVSVTLSCPAGIEGVATSEIVKLAPEDDGDLQINVVGSEDPPQALMRCP